MFCLVVHLKYMYIVFISLKHLLRYCHRAEVALWAGSRETNGAHSVSVIHDIKERVVHT